MIGTSLEDGAGGVGGRDGGTTQTDDITLAVDTASCMAFRERKPPVTDLDHVNDQGAYVIAAVGSAERGAGLRELGADEVVVGLDGVAPVYGVLEHIGGPMLWTGSLRSRVHSAE
jgi:hypothetical protein